MLFTATLFFLAILGLLFLVQPKYQAFKQLKAQERFQQTQVENRERFFAQLEEISQRFEGYGEALDKINSALPSSPQMSLLLNFLNKTAEKNGLLLKEIGPVTTSKLSPQEIEKIRGKETAQGGKELKETRVSLEILGDYPSFKNFLAALEKSARLIEIENVKFNTLKTGAGLFRFNLQIKVYSY